MSAPASASASCDTIQSRGGYDLVFFKLNMKCGTAKHYAKKLMRDGSYDPRGFDCHRQNPDNGGCESTRRARKFFIFYTPDRVVPSRRGGFKRCSGSVHVRYFGTASKIRVKNIGCDDAKRAIKKPATAAGFDGPMGEPKGGGTLVTCSKGSKAIRFLLG